MTHDDLSFSPPILTQGCWFVHLLCIYRQETSRRLDHNMSKTVDKCLLCVEEKLVSTQLCLWMMFNLCWKSCQKVTYSEMGILFFSLSHSVLLCVIFVFTGLCSLWVLLLVWPWAVHCAEVSNTLICCGRFSGGAYNYFLSESSSSILTTAKDPVSSNTFSFCFFVKPKK